jgi:GNAT superfamily N-acetyltransferase
MEKGSDNSRLCQYAATLHFVEIIQYICRYSEYHIAMHMTHPKNIALSLPDIPRWIYARWMMLSGTGILFGTPSTEDVSMVVVNPDNGLTCVIGTPAAEHIHEAMERGGANVRLIAYSENFDHIKGFLSGWTESPAILHTLRNDRPITNNAGIHRIKFLSRSELETLTDLPSELLAELTAAIIYSKVAALYIRNKPVSFCYAAAETETLWDVSIDTLEPYRNKGYAEACVSFMIDHMHRLNKHPVWGAELTNLASTRLAEKLGFRPVDSLVLLTPRE